MRKFKKKHFAKCLNCCNMLQSIYLDLSTIAYLKYSKCKSFYGYCKWICIEIGRYKIV